MRVASTSKESAKLLNLALYSQITGILFCICFPLEDSPGILFEDIKNHIQRKAVLSIQYLYELELPLVEWPFLWVIKRYVDHTTGDENRGFNCEKIQHPYQVLSSQL